MWVTPRRGEIGSDEPSLNYPSAELGWKLYKCRIFCQLSGTALLTRKALKHGKEA